VSVERRETCSMNSAIALIALLSACGHSASNDGAKALASFREFIASQFAEKIEDHICKLRTDVRATRGVAEPWEGIVHLELTFVEPDGKPDDFPLTEDLVFDHVGGSWICSAERSLDPRDSAKNACVLIKNACERRDAVQHGAQPAIAQQPQPVKSVPVVKPSPKPQSTSAGSIASPYALYPRGWTDLPPPSDALMAHANGWKCSESDGGDFYDCQRCLAKELTFSCADFTLGMFGDPLPGQHSSSASVRFNAHDPKASLDTVADELTAQWKVQPDQRDSKRACWHSGQVRTVLDIGDEGLQLVVQPGKCE
jgi:hypothetical protein